MSANALDRDLSRDALDQETILFSETLRGCDVSPYTDEYESIKNTHIVLEKTECTSLELAETSIIILHKGLWKNTNMENTLVNPNQLRHFGVTVQENPYSSYQLYI